MLFLLFQLQDFYWAINKVYLGHIWRPLGYVITPLCWKKRKRNTKLTTQETFKKTHIVQETKRQWQIKSVDMLFFEIQEIWRDHSMMKISCKVTKKTTEKFWKYIINFKTIRFKLSAWANINQSIFKFILCDRSPIYGYLRKIERKKVSKALK